MNPSNRPRSRHRILITTLSVFTAVLATARVASATCDVADYDDPTKGADRARAAIQAAIDACAASGDLDVYIPTGTYVLSQSPAGQWNLKVPSKLRLRGASQSGVVLQQANQTGGSVPVLFITGDDIHIEDMTLDGNKAQQTVEEHRHGTFAFTTNRLVIQNVTARNFTGDGFYFYNEANQSIVRNVIATGNVRNGLTFGGNSNGASVTGSQFIGNGVQQIDSEPVGTNTVNNITITDCTLDATGGSGAYVLTVSGPGSASRSTGWKVAGNTLNGGTLMVWVDNVLFANNTGINATPRPSVETQARVVNISIIGNNFHLTQPLLVANQAGILIAGSAADNMAEGVVIANNTVQIDDPNAFGVQATGVVSVRITNNRLRGAGVASAPYAGINVRAAVPTVDFRTAVIAGNTIANFGQFGISVDGNLDAKLLSLDVLDNIMDNDTTTPSMTIGIRLSDDANPAKQISMFGNQFLRGVSLPIYHYPQNAIVLIGGSPGINPIYSVIGTPEGQVAAPVGSLAIRRDGGSGTTYYVKQSGTGNTGWVAK